MDHLNLTLRRLVLYLLGIFFLSLGVSFSIEADLGVSPVSSIAYAFTLASGFSVGAMTVVSHVFFIFLQVILSKRFDLRESIVQLIIAFLFGFFVDMTLFLVQLLPTPDTLPMQFVFLLISLFSVAFGLFGYMSAKLPLIPYDELTHDISERFNLKFSRAKVTSDSLSVVVAGIICLISIQSLGSIGIGTIIAALFVGRILGWISKYFRKPLEHWLNNEKKTIDKEESKITRVEEENTSFLS